MHASDPGSNWSQNLAYSARDLVEPASLDELRALVGRSERIRALGTRHSFSPIADTPGTLVSLSRMPGDLDVDTAARTVRVPAATRYGNLARLLDTHGLALGAMASLPHISVAGAIATGTHGSGTAQRALPSAVVGLELVTAGGDLLTVSPDDERLAAMTVALGALGVVTAVTLALEPAVPIRQAVYLDLPVEATDQASLDAVLACGSSVSLFTRWQGPGADQVWVKQRVDATPTAEGIPIDETAPFPDRLHGAHRAPRPVHPVPGMPPQNCTDQSGAPGPFHERLPHFRLEFTPSAGEEIQTEYLIERSDLAAAIAALRQIAGALDPVLLVSEIRTIAADGQWLSMAHGRRSAALHFTWRRDAEAVRRATALIESALEPYAPRPHWGKVHTLDAAVVRSRYERADDFARLAAHLDPTGKFTNPMLEGLGLAGGAGGDARRIS